MALGSRLKAVERRLVTIIDGRTPGLDGVAVDRGHPGEHLTREHVWIDRTRFGEQAVSLAETNRKRDQDVTVEIMVRVSQEGDDVTALKDRCLDVVDEVEEALRADPDLAGAALFGGISGGEVDSFADTDGRVCAARLDATYKARKG